MSTSTPVVSVIVPQYNHADFLEQRLRSIFEQTWQDFELIYLDDASTDHSTEIFTPFATDPRVRSVFNQVNSGNSFRQWNQGVAMARGRYVWIAESDDWAEPVFLERLVAALEANHRVGIAYSQSRRVNDDGEVVSSGLEWTDDLDPERWKHDFVNEGRDECRRYLTVKNTIPNASAVVFRKEVFDAVGGAAEQLRYTGDWMTWARMLLRSDVAFLADAWNHFRRHDRTVRHRSVLDGTWAEEAYGVLRFMIENVEPDPSAVDRALDGFLRKWVTSAHNSQGRMSLDDHLRVYDLARQMDPALMRRLVGQMRPRRMLTQARLLLLMLSRRVRSQA